ncbi:hypothetical protein [Chamaesiphon polymorphus]|uniref:Uncharacterized protein n=1 Tax=Chamaesiphon polymorphus CCALA 037 TaxID=2107692 RepID=A0A2T1GD12_9CYAN|nr:hypothetical protein [Chamaesiphon polymorphus]PSB55316.1 hypothetical protein C7B77_15430 [Chamaesiphon polymorphus CCALA 037]
MLPYRSRFSLLIITLLLLVTSSIAKAQQAPDEALVKAALLVRTVDRLSAQCKAGKGFNEKQSAAIATWETAQNVNNIRTQLGSLSSELQQQIDRGSTNLITALRKNYSTKTPCEIAANIITTPTAKFATSNSNPEPRNNSNPNPSSTVTTSSSAIASRVSEIDSFGFDTRASIGVGGFVTQDIYPVVLFRNGNALKNVSALTSANGLAEHRQARPKDWTQWRRSSGKVELLTATKGWKALPFSATYQALPADFQLNGTYRSLSGTGNVAIGGSASVAAWKTYTFSSDGRVIRGSGAGGSNAGVATSSVSPAQRGRYKIDGLMLRMTYDDGSTEERLIIANPKDPKTAIWLDGTGYSRSRK